MTGVEKAAHVTTGNLTDYLGPVIYLETDLKARSEIGIVTGLAWTPSSVAEIIQGVLSWVPPAQTVLSYTVTIRKGAEVVQTFEGWPNVDGVERLRAALAR